MSETNAVERVREFLARFPYDIPIYEFDESTWTAELAAQALGVELGQIAKTVMFTIGEEPVLVVASGDVRISRSRLKRHLGLSGKVRLADAETITHLTGFAPGGVCPFALKQPVPILIDKSLERFSVVYIATGSPHSAAPMSLDQLLTITGGHLADVAE